MLLAFPLATVKAEIRDFKRVLLQEPPYHKGQQSQESLQKGNKIAARERLEANNIGLDRKTLCSDLFFCGLDTQSRRHVLV